MSETELAEQFIEYALEAGVLRFGEFTLKSGRVSPYFFNAAGFNTGAHLAALARFYAAAAVDGDADYDMVFGPAYKGIPLVASVAVQLSEYYGFDVPWSFNRKEAKDHGEGGSFVGSQPAGRVLLIDDVITAGTAIREVIDVLSGTGAELSGVLISVDRQERGSGALSAIEQVERDYGVGVRAIVTMDHIIEYMRTSGNYHQYLEPMLAYREQYGADRDGAGRDAAGPNRAQPGRS